MQINQIRLLNEFCTLVSIDSPSFKERQMGDYLKTRLTELGLTVSEDATADKIGGTCGNIYGFLDGDNTAAPLLFSSHMDTVAPAYGKKAVIHENGKITSDGTTVLGADDCAGIAAILEALTIIKENNLPHRPIEVLFSVAEEVYCKGAVQFDVSNLKSKEAYVLDLAGTVGSAAYKAPTILHFTVTITGKASHAGFAPEQGIHAISAAANAITQVQLGRIDNDTTVNIGIIEGGVATNIIPDLCTVKGEIRSFNHPKAVEHAEQVKQIFESAANQLGATITFKSGFGSEAYEIPQNCPAVARFLSACEKTNLTATLCDTLGGSDFNFLAKCGFTGLVIAPGMYLCHSVTEYTEQSELAKAAELTLTLMTMEE